MKSRPILALAAGALLLCTGCSYKALDEQIQQTVQQAQQAVQQAADPEDDDGIDGYTDEGRPYVVVPPAPEDDMEIKGPGGSFSAYRVYTVHYDDPEFEDLPIERGTQGLTYTLKGAEAFGSIYESGVDLYGCQIEDQAILENMSFVLVELEASYTAPAGSDAAIIADAGELSGVALQDRMTQQMEEEMYPAAAYFSLRPQEDDPDLDKGHDFFAYRIQEGEPVTFQLGLLCGPSYVEGGNVYLEVNEAPSLEQEMSGDTTRKLFALFPEQEG